MLSDNVRYLLEVLVIVVVLACFFGFVHLLFSDPLKPPNHGHKSTGGVRSPRGGVSRGFELAYGHDRSAPYLCNSLRFLPSSRFAPSLTHPVKKLHGRAEVPNLSVLGIGPKRVREAAWKLAVTSWRKDG